MQLWRSLGVTVAKTGKPYTMRALKMRWFICLRTWRVPEIRAVVKLKALRTFQSQALFSFLWAPILIEGFLRGSCPFSKLVEGSHILF